jgi:hypothetical protein
MPCHLDFITKFIVKGKILLEEETQKGSSSKKEKEEERYSFGGGERRGAELGLLSNSFARCVVIKAMTSLRF